jgi:glycosyltransferase involved in cell wall biosynthesis
MKKKLIIIGPAWPLRGGGMSTFNERLALEFIHQGFDTTIYTFSLQYPNFLFPGSSQYSNEPAPEGIPINVCINSINPFNWWKIGNELKELSPDYIVVRYWIPLMGPCFGTILRRVRKNRHTKIICIADNIIPHEHRPGDTLFTRYFVKPVDAFITLSRQVQQDLQQFTRQPSRLVPHPLYDNFGAALSKETARTKLGLPVADKIILFFGFIRKYKGLDLLLEAMADERIRHAGIRLMIAGEFYENREEYDKLIERLQIAPRLILHTGFIPNRDVTYYLSATDFVIQPYRDATQSGVTPLAYHFEKPMLVTNVGSLPDLVPDGKVGLVTEPNAKAIASGILDLYELGEDHFLPHLRKEKQQYSWARLVASITTIVS